VPGRPATDQQVKLYMTSRHRHPQRVAAAASGISERTGRRIERDPRPPSQKAAERPRAPRPLPRQAAPSATAKAGEDEVTS